MSLWGYIRKKVITVTVNFECHSRAALLYQRKIILQFDEFFVLSFSERGFSWFGSFFSSLKKLHWLYKSKGEVTTQILWSSDVGNRKKWRCSEGKMHHFCFLKKFVIYSRLTTRKDFHKKGSTICDLCNEYEKYVSIWKKYLSK